MGFWLVVRAGFFFFKKKEKSMQFWWATVPACNLVTFFLFLRFMTGGCVGCGGYNSGGFSVFFHAGCTRFLLVQELTQNWLHV